jgi:hypothetical protein
MTNTETNPNQTAIAKTEQETKEQDNRKLLNTKASTI